MPGGIVVSWQQPRSEPAESLVVHLGCSQVAEKSSDFKRWVRSGGCAHWNMHAPSALLDVPCPEVLQNTRIWVPGLAGRFGTLE